MESDEAGARRGGSTLADLRQARQRNQGAIPQADKASDVGRQRVIIEAASLSVRAGLEAKLALLGGTITRRHDAMGLVTVEVPAERVRELAADENVAYVSPDRPVVYTGHVETTTGAAQLRSPSGGFVSNLLGTLLGSTTLDGSGIGITVIDSGIDDSHDLIKSGGSHPGIVARQSFTGGDARKDRYGHGTVVATLAAGSSAVKAGAYRGVAPGAGLISLQALDDKGQGTASNIIAALDWCIANKSVGGFTIRVLNLSLGTAAKDSYLNDPLCLAARRAVDAGFVVVVAAGNVGKDEKGNKIYGTIHSPGIEPSVITVGAANAFGTDARSDDKVATYSSHGPTRGFWTDEGGVKHYDNLIKPDLVAPGNKLIAAASQNPDTSDKWNNLTRNQPSLAVSNGASVSSRVMYLSGTSVATPVVAGAAALLLQTNSMLTPNLVKALLMYTAQPLAGFNTLEQGAGLLNVDGAVGLAAIVKSNPSSLSNGAPVLTDSLPSPTSTIADEKVLWAQGIVAAHCLLYGSDFVKLWQGMYAKGMTFSDATSVAHGKFQTSPRLVTDGVGIK